MGLFDRFKKPKTNDADSNVRKEEVKKVNDQETLNKNPKWEDDNPNVRKKAVEELDDQEILIKIATNDPDWAVRWRAVEKISDESILIDIAKNDSDSNVRGEAVKKIKEESVLADIAKNDLDKRVRGAAIKNDYLKDNQILYEIAMKEESTYYIDVVEKISDENLLIDIAKHKTGSSNRERAVNKIHNQEVLIDFAYNDEEAMVRNTALSNIYDEDVLKDMIYNGDYGQKMSASKNITDSETIIDVAFNEEEEFVRVNVIEKITDEEALKKLSRDNDTLVRRAAIENNHLKDKSTLKYVAANDENKPNRDIAIERLDSLNEDIAYTQEELLNCLENHELYSELSNEDIKTIKDSITNEKFINPDTINDAIILLVAKQHYE